MGEGRIIWRRVTFFSTVIGICMLEKNFVNAPLFEKKITVEVFEHATFEKIKE